MSSSEGSRFSEYTPNDHQAPLWIATSITLAYAGLFLIVRIAVKFKVLGLDDLFLGVAHVLGIAQWGVMFTALKNGVGKRDDPQTETASLVFASRILTLLTLGVTKCSVFLFLRQFFAKTSDKGWNICTWLAIGTGFWTVVSTLATSIGCAPSGALLLESSAQCNGDLTRWRVVTGVDVVVEVILVIIPMVLFFSVQISRARKFTIFAAFVPRIAVPAIFIAYFEAYVHFRKHDGTSIAAVGTLIWQQLLCGYSLMSATTPCLKGFLGRFRTEDLARVTDDSYGTRTYGQNSRENTHADSYALESIDRKNSVRRAPIHEPPIPAARPADPLHTATAYADFGDNGDGSVKSFGSERMMIHRKVEYAVTSS